jgi:hypothetical protein
MPGKIDVLNTGAGHLSIDVPDDADDISKANYERIITDMLKRGYLLFVERKGKHIKIDSYDPKTKHYILANYPEAHQVAAEIAADDPAEPKPVTKRGRPPKVKASKANVTAVARSAGG